MKNRSQVEKSVLSMQKNNRIIYNWRTLAAIIIIINNDLENIIWTEYLKNKQAQWVLKKLTEEFKKTNTELLLFNKLVHVSEHQ